VTAGEIKGVLSPRNSMVTFHLRIQNPFEGRVGLLFDMLSKTQRMLLLDQSHADRPTGEVQFF